MQGLLKKISGSAAAKFISFVLVASFVAMPVFLVQQNKAEAFIPALPVVEVGVVLVNSSIIAAAAVTTAASAVGMAVKEFALDAILWIIVKVIIQKITAALVSWINSGFNGAPAFVQNPEQFFKNIGNIVVGEVIWRNPELNFLCSPFSVDFQLALEANYTQRPFDVRCTLSDVIGNIQAFTDDFYQGDWVGLHAMAMNDNNNPYGAFLQTRARINTEIETRQGVEARKLDWGRGFLTWEEPICLNPDESMEDCTRKDIRTNTPGSVIETQLENHLGSGIRQLEIADEINEVIGALIAQLANKALGLAARGLRGLTGGDIDDDGAGMRAQQNRTVPEGTYNPGTPDQFVPRVDADGNPVLDDDGNQIIDFVPSTSPPSAAIPTPAGLSVLTPPGIPNFTINTTGTTIVPPAPGGTVVGATCTLDTSRRERRCTGGTYTSPSGSVYTGGTYTGSADTGIPCTATTCTGTTHTGGTYTGGTCVSGCSSTSNLSGSNLAGGTIGSIGGGGTCPAGWTCLAPTSPIVGGSGGLPPGVSPSPYGHREDDGISGPNYIGPGAVTSESGRCYIHSVGQRMEVRCNPVIGTTDIPIGGSYVGGTCTTSDGSVTPGSGSFAAGTCTGGRYVVRYPLGYVSFTGGTYTGGNCSWGASTGFYETGCTGGTFNENNPVCSANCGFITTDQIAGDGPIRRYGGKCYVQIATTIPSTLPSGADASLYAGTETEAVCAPLSCSAPTDTHEKTSIYYNQTPRTETGYLVRTGATGMTAAVIRELEFIDSDGDRVYPVSYNVPITISADPDVFHPELVPNMFDGDYNTTWGTASTDLWTSNYGTNTRDVTFVLPAGTQLAEIRITPGNETTFIASVFAQNPTSGAYDIGLMGYDTTQVGSCETIAIQVAPIN